MVLGIVAEYNPFHKGHLYQIEQAKKLSGASHVVAVMSGGFVQRGDVSVCNKWARTKMALLNGVDLVVELPAVYATQSAEFFARGAIGILDALNVDRVSFGAETDDVDALSKVADMLNNPSEKYRHALEHELKKGVSFPRARDAALGECGELLRSPNNILGVEYIRAGAKNPLPIKRAGVQHDSADISDGFASASHIRKLIFENDYKQAAEYMPESAFEILMSEIDKGRAPVAAKELDRIIIANLRKEAPEKLREIADVSEGIENRITQLAGRTHTLIDLADAVRTKRFTHARIRRILISYLLGITDQMRKEPPQYIRVLGGNKNGLELLNRAKLPIVTKAAMHKEIIKNDVIATDLYTLLYKNTDFCYGGQDYTTSPII